LPLVRKAERNNYRASLIGFQRARRALMAFEDAIVRDIRIELRNLRLLARNYAIQKQIIQLAYPQVISAEQAIFGPGEPPAVGAGRPPRTSDIAGKTQQLLSALQGLLGAQNQIYGIWVDYQLSRLRLFRDLELMQIDSRGVWLDELATIDQSTDLGDPPGEPQRPEPGAPEELPPPAPIPVIAIGPVR
jgi:hypothetical protein